MKTKLHHRLLGLVTVLALGACTPSAQQLKKALEENPDILTNAIEKNPDKVMDALNKAARDARDVQAKNAEEERGKALENEFKNPKQPVIEADRAIFGKADAPITIVEYSDFECPYCSKGYSVIKEVKKKYGDKVRIVFKHLPLDFHPQALPAAKYFEAVAQQGTDKAEKFHDLVFEKQDKLKSDGEKFLLDAAKKVGADIAKVKKAVGDAKTMARITADKEEAQKFEFFGTPGFLINGVSIKGAYPADEFYKIIDRLEKK